MSYTLILTLITLAVIGALFVCAWMIALAVQFADDPADDDPQGNSHSHPEVQSPWADRGGDVVVFDVSSTVSDLLHPQANTSRGVHDHARRN